MTNSRTTRIAALFALGLMTAACAEGSTTIETTPEVQSRQLAQLSAGGGIASYDFMVGATKVGALLVTEAIFDAQNGTLDTNINRYCSAGICNQMEYWRWDEDNLATIEAGLSGPIAVTVNGTSTTYSSSIVADFEANTTDFLTWDINRLFDFSDGSSVQWNAPPLGTVLLTVEATPWDGFDEAWDLAMAGNPLLTEEQGESVTYFLKMQFDGVSAIPEMTWYLDYSTYNYWDACVDEPTCAASSSTGDEIFEVRLNDDSELSMTTLMLGYELKTLSL